MEKGKRTGKFQNVAFANVNEFLDFLPEEELVITEYLRELIFECIPGIYEKLSYNVPFYKLHKTICFIWPASVLWGNKMTYEGVRLGFTQGYLLNNEFGLLKSGNRKQVYWCEFLEISEIKTQVLRSYFSDAIMVDEQLRIK